MSEFTTELRFLEENWNDDVMFGNYPIFDESYRLALNRKIRDHYYFEEIGLETPARFCQRMRTKMQEIMPYYNQLYESQLKEIDPFITKRYGYTTSDLLNAVKSGSSESNKSVNDIVSELLSNSEKSTTSSGNEDLIFGSEKSSSNFNENYNEHSDKDNHTTYQDEKTVNVRSGSEKHNDHIVNTTVTKDVSSDTPEGLVKLNDIENDMYASNAHITHVKNTPTGDNTITYNDVKDTNTKSGGHVESGEANSNGDKGGTSKTNNQSESNSISTTQTDSKKAGESVSEKTNNLSEIVKAIMEDITNEEKNGSYKTEGFDGTTMSEMLTKWRETFLNIDMMIINELNSLFMGVLM